LILEPKTTNSQDSTSKQETNKAELLTKCVELGAGVKKHAKHDAQHMIFDSFLGICKPAISETNDKK